MSVPKAEPIKLKEYTVRQYNYYKVGQIHIRSIIFGPSGSGETDLLQILIFEYMHTLFRITIYIYVSLSIDVDSSCIPVKESVEKELQVQPTDKDLQYLITTTLILYIHTGHPT